MLDTFTYTYRVSVYCYCEYIIIRLAGVIFCCKMNSHTSSPPREAFFFGGRASICHANTDPPVTKIRPWASFGV